MKHGTNSVIFITGGHATPAVACIRELQDRGYKNIYYIGQKHSILFDKNPSSEYRLITEILQIPFINILAGKLSLFFDVSSLIWILRLPVGFIHGLFIHLAYKPDAVLTFGSHVGMPVVFWASLFGVKVVAHEQTVTIGRANKFIQKFASTICYSWEAAVSRLTTEGNKEKLVYTGNPIRKEIFSVTTNVFTFATLDKPTIFITGGNQGAHILNDWIFTNLEKICQFYNVIHQTGSNTIYNDFARAETLAENVNKIGAVYIPKAYFFVEEMAEAYAKSVAVISRAGANTVTELLALEKKSVLIPIPTASGNEQFLNAELLASLNMSVVLEQSDLSSTDILEVLERVRHMECNDPQKLSALAARHLGAEQRIVDQLLTEK